ncbi:D-TA family PLP-dependent enzyme [Planktotalea arctica]|uniref:D-TA family PLP-dependent enzyme n=1 Tax=Planktotalea arctica TaxID=1481893 RepID=UPI000A173E1D|nr:D-TA family PLP-dependent enzyme [Planktotalea arctica]
MATDINSIHTPAFVVNEAVALQNIAAFQAHCDQVGLALRPHIKTHKSVHFAKAQLAAGANGITCQKISEAEAMAVDGIDDILITYNILGDAKLRRLRALSERLTALAVVADNMVVINGLSRTFSGASEPLKVLVECDTGAGRCGVQSPEAAVALAEKIAVLPGLQFGGLMTYPAVGGAKNAAEFLRETKKLLDECGLACPVISSGGSPDMWSATTDGIISEYRIGTYIYNDRSLVRAGACTWDECAGHVVATVVSTPTPERAIIDAGSKVLTSDLLGFTDHGHVVGHPEIRVVGLSEEHGTLSVDPQNPLAIGQRIRIVPNHVCVVSNMFDEIWIEGSDGNLAQLSIDARGRVI